MGRPGAVLVGVAALLAIGGGVAAVVLLGLETASPAIAVAAIAALLVLAARPGRGATRTLEVERELDALEARIVQAREQRYQMRMQAETAGRFREEFVGAVRHELNTPLNAILGFSDVLLQEVDGPLNEQQIEDVRQVRAAGSYLSELVDAVLAEWSPDRATPIPSGPVDVETLFDRVVRLLAGQRGSRPVEMSWSVDDDFVPPPGDPRRLVQVLMNLGSNALRATTRGHVRFRARNGLEHAELQIIDTGSGLSDEDIARVFRAFEQASGPRSTATSGAGLGLAIAKELVEQHGGHITVESKLGRGSTFTVHLPRGPA